MQELDTGLAGTAFDNFFFIKKIHGIHPGGGICEIIFQEALIIWQKG